MTEEFAKSILQIPTISGREDWMIETIEQWCRDNRVSCMKDGHGNLYLKKGGGTWMPCVTSHMDTVHRDQEEYIDRHELLPLQQKGDKIYIPKGPNGQQTGVGADCKAGIAICLEIVKAQTNIKACFFVKEEVGMQGSAHLDESWFSDVAYVIGFDSPEHNRAAKSCSGILLFDDEFFNSNIKDVAEKHGVTSFRYEPYTDVVNIRKKTGIICMNFGNGGYHPHQKSEYVMFSEMSEAEALGNELINTIPLNKQYTLDANQRPQYSWTPSYSTTSSWGSWRTQPTANPEQGQSRLARYAAIRAEEQRKAAEARSSRPGEERPDDFADDWEDSWQTDPSDEELDAIEQEESNEHQTMSQKDIDEFFEWLNDRK